MNETRILIPFTENSIFFHDSNVDFIALMGFSLSISVLKQFMADFLMPIFRKNAKVAQFAFPIVLHQK